MKPFLPSRRYKWIFMMAMIVGTFAAEFAFTWFLPNCQGHPVNFLIGFASGFALLPNAKDDRDPEKIT